MKKQDREFLFGKNKNLNQRYVDLIVAQVNQLTSKSTKARANLGRKIMHILPRGFRMQRGQETQ